MNDIYQSLRPLMKKKAAIADPATFQQLVNVIFHDFEAKYYDEVHREMWESLPQQYQIIINEIKPHIQCGHELKLLDIGCGTGLATELLLQTELGADISEVHLLDTSTKMLAEAVKRSKGWKKNTKIINGIVSDIDGWYDIIIISSVLHHIPDLVAFLDEVTRIQQPGGILITIHDPNSGSLESADYTNRTAEYEKYQKNGVSKKAPLDKRIINKLRRVLKLPNYIDKINKKLQQEAIITEPLDERELWSITDIHVENLPYSVGKGISREMLVNHLQQYLLLSYRTYAFFGYLYSNLDDLYKKKEIELGSLNDPHGRNFCSAWLKKTTD